MQHDDAERTVFVVLDLNGTLLSYHKAEDQLERKSRFRWINGGKVVRFRPGLEELLEMLFSSGHDFRVATWSFSGGVKANAHLVELAFGKWTEQLCFQWTREQCASPRKPKKDLNAIWKEFPSWNPSRTIIFDDSPSKMTHMDHALIVPTFNGKKSFAQNGAVCNDQTLELVGRFLLYLSRKDFKISSQTTVESLIPIHLRALFENKK